MSEIFPDFTFVQGILVIALSLGVCVLFWAMGRFGKWRTAIASAEHHIPAVFLFQNGVLEDANAPAHAFMAGQLGETPCDWSALSKVLETRFSDIPAALGTASGKETKTHTALLATDPSFLTIEQWGARSRISLFDTSPCPKKSDGTQKLELNEALNQAPNPVWHSSDAGEIVWANAAYGELAKNLGRECSDGFPELFSNLPMQTNPEPRRTALSGNNPDHSYWFDVTSVAHTDGQTHYAIDANAIVNAEVAQRNFVQTLTKTFAQLSIGLALFDRNRQLALFNPALIDLTNLPADFLSSRPSLLSFFDRLRENRVMPEPKNYSSWREQIAELVVAATDDRYCETWTLPSGVTYRVIGRPHPDGAIALLFEDISAEVSLTRRFRAELELSQSILDAIEQPMAVFSPGGSMNFCNRAYQKFWKEDPTANLNDYSIDHAINTWKAKCKDSPSWPVIRQHIRHSTSKSLRQFPLTLSSGLPLNLTTTAIHGGASLVLFKVSTPKPSPQKTPEKLVV